MCWIKCLSLNVSSWLLLLNLVLPLSSRVFYKVEGPNLATPLPTFVGLDTAQLAPQLTGSSTFSSQPTPLAAQPTGDIKYSLSASDRERFTGFFNTLDPVNGVVSGAQARDLFVQSMLPMETLGQIWRLVDSAGSGSLNLNQFIMAMVLITMIKSGQLTSVPSTLPLQLSSLVAGSTPTPTKSSFDSNRVDTGEYKALTIGITEVDRRKYEGYFASLDTTKKGSLTGAESYSFFVKSKLAANELAQIW